MKYAALLVLALLVACGSQSGPAEEVPMKSESSPESPTEVVELPNLGPAPELENDVWLNTDAPLRLAELRGKVVLLDMWTFG